MFIVTIIIIVVLCLVAVQVVVVFAYIAAKRYYYEKLRKKARIQRLKTFAMSIPQAARGASAKFDRLREDINRYRRRSGSVGKARKGKHGEEPPQTLRKRSLSL